MAEPAAKRQKTGKTVTVLGAGYAGLTTAAELAIRGYKVRVVAKDFGYQPPMTICGTQSRRHPGIAICNKIFDKDDLLDKELASLHRFIALAGRTAETGVSVVPAIKVSRKEGVWWNARPLDAERKKVSTETQRQLDLAASPARADPAVKEKLLAVGYKSVDETTVVAVESQKYFRYLCKVIKDHGGCICMGVELDSNAVTASDSSIVVNCLGLQAGEVGGAEGEYTNNPGEELIFSKPPADFPFYIIDDDTNGTMIQGSDGCLCLSSGAKPKHLLSNSRKGSYDLECSQQTIDDAALLMKAVFGDCVSLKAEDACESWSSDRPMREAGFNIGAKKREDGKIVVQNSGHGGAGVTTSWATAILAADALAAVETN
eukprot:TRINITY_DN55670_c0_g1_i1.p1 TRINITY_DN55670_c0_g1~~TRINITY_DN55670_c0_g1_i1.p1  ORF type:complete len:397 (+),score=80.46 TRINITY_DN55670_c0_g1_i1:71-1192(+)